jgi:hypothetical protein
MSSPFVLSALASRSHSHRSHIKVSGPPNMHSKRSGRKRKAAMHSSKVSMGMSPFSSSSRVFCITSVTCDLLVMANRPSETTSLLALVLCETFFPLASAASRVDATKLVTVKCGMRSRTCPSGMGWHTPSPRHCSADSPGLKRPCWCNIETGIPFCRRSASALLRFTAKSIPARDTRSILTVRTLGGYIYSERNQETCKKGKLK